MLVYLRESSVVLVCLVGPLLMVLACFALVAEAGQVGLIVSSEPLAFTLSRLGIVRGLKRMLGFRDTQQSCHWDLPKDVCRAFVCMLVLLGLTGIYLLYFSSNALTNSVTDSGELARVLLTVGRTLAGAMLVWIWILSALGCIRAHKQRRDRLRMSIEEFTRELRESEGNPETRAMRRHAHQEVLMHGMLQGLRRAKVLIVGSATRNS